MRVRMPAARTAVVARTVRLGRFRLRSFIALLSLVVCWMADLSADRRGI
jgi:hypothetical protein